MRGLVVLLCSLVACGDESPELRRWTSEDHGQPVPAGGDTRVAAEGESGATTPEEQRARAASALWQMSCATCHGRQGRGTGSGLPPGAVVPDFTAEEWQAEHSDQQIAEVIRLGRGVMPPFGDRIREEGIQALIEHVRRLGGTSAPSSE